MNEVQGEEQLTGNNNNNYINCSSVDNNIVDDNLLFNYFKCG